MAVGGGGGLGEVRAGLGLGLLARMGRAEVMVVVEEVVAGRSVGVSAFVLANVPFSLGVRFAGVLKGETKGLERVAEAASRRRRLVAGVEVIVGTLLRCQCCGISRLVCSLMEQSTERILGVPART